MRKIFIVLFLFVFLSTFISASLPTVKQGECVNIRTILNATSVNISTLTYPSPNQTTLILDSPMTKNGKTFNYSFCSTDVLGNYVYDYYDDEGNTYVNDFEVTPSGKSGDANIVFFIFFIVLFYTLTFIGVFGRIWWIATLGGMAMVFLGIYLIQNGVIIFRDDLTLYLGYITTFLGGGIAIWSVVDYLEII